MQNLQPATLLYKVSGPAVVEHEGAVSLLSLARYGGLTLVAAFFLVVVGCTVYDALQRESTRTSAASHPPQPSS